MTRRGFRAHPLTDHPALLLSQQIGQQMGRRNSARFGTFPDWRYDFDWLVPAWLQAIDGME